jgi:hypothetical protein
VARRKPSPRAERREHERAAEKLARDRERLAKLEPGGDGARPVEVESASQVEPHAFGLPCPRCGGPLRLVEHAALTVDGDRLRVARMVCPACNTAREAWFRLAPRLPN